MIGFQEQISPKSTEELVDIYLNSDGYQEEYIQLVQSELKSRNFDFGQIDKERAEKPFRKDELIASRPSDTAY
jgi:hypothetical protein